MAEESRKKLTANPTADVTTSTYLMWGDKKEPSKVRTAWDEMLKR